MENYIERELKILVSKEQFKKILNSYEFKKPITQTNTYYDTNDQKIKHMNGALRIRTIENTHIFTLKIKKDSITHYEYEKEIQTTNINEIKDPEILGWIQQYDIPTNIKPITSFEPKDIHIILNMDNYVLILHHMKIISIMNWNMNT